MAGPDVKDLYGNEGSVPAQQEVNGTGAKPMDVRATPEAFGAGVGEATAKLGDTAQDLVQKYQGMQNEAIATNADLDTQAKMGEIYGKYNALQGQAKIDAAKPTIAAINDVMEQQKANLTPVQTMAYNQRVSYSVGRTIREIGETTASAYKEQYTKAAADDITFHVMSGNNPSIAMSDHDSGMAIGNIKATAPLVIPPDHPGLTRDQDTNQITGFTNDAAGQQAASMHSAVLNSQIGQFQVNRFNTIANVAGPVAAYNKFQAEKAGMPPSAAITLDSTLLPQVTQAKAQDVSSVVLAKAAQEHSYFLQNPQATLPKDENNGVPAFIKNEGTGQNPNSSASGKGQYLDSTWLQDVRKFHPEMSGQSDAQILALKKNDDAFKDDMIAKSNGANVQALTQSLGRAPTASETALAWQQGAAGATALIKNPDMTAIAALTSAGVNPQLAAKSILQNGGGTQTSAADFVQKQNDFYGKNGGYGAAQTANVQPQLKSYRTNPDGSPYTQVNYYMDHPDRIEADAKAYAEKAYPNDPVVAQKGIAQIKESIASAIKAQKDGYEDDRNYIQRGLNGDFTDGKRPETYTELSQIPKLGDVLKRTAANQPDFVKNINEQIKAASSGDINSKLYNEDGVNPVSTVAGRAVKGYGGTGYGAGFLQASQDIAFGKVTDMGALADQVKNGDLTSAGYKALQEQIVKPSNPIENAQKYKALSQIVKNLSFQSDVTGARDPNGQRIVSEAMPILMKQLNNIPEGKTLSDLTNPNSPDYIGKSVEGLKRSPVQLRIDAMDAGQKYTSISQSPKRYGALQLTPEQQQAAYNIGKETDEDEQEAMRQRALQ